MWSLALPLPRSHGGEPITNQCPGSGSLTEICPADFHWNVGGGDAGYRRDMTTCQLKIDGYDSLQTTDSDEFSNRIGPMPQNQLELTIVMPCLDEAETLGICIKKASDWLRANDVKGEIVIGDNGSTDGSQKIATDLGARVIDVETRGYGAALIGAIENAQGKFVIMADSDDSYDFTALMPFVEKLREGFDLVMGNRFRGGIAPGAMPWKNRYIGNPILSFVGRLFFRCPAKDFHCGLRGFTKDAFIRMNLSTTGMEFASEMVIKATLNSMRITEVPTTLSPDGRSRPPHLNPWRDGWRHLRFMLIFSPKWLFFYPGLFFLSFGLAVGTWLLPERRQIGSVFFDIQTMLYSWAIFVIGFQGVYFSIFSKVFAASRGLIPQNPRLERALNWVSLEVGLVIGIVLALLGIGGAVFSLVNWGHHAFGQLDANEAMRWAIPSAVSVIIGFQIILGSFFIGLLRMPTRSTVRLRG